MRKKATMQAAITALALMSQAAMAQETKGKYAVVNGLKMYYEVHGSGKPLLLLHGAFGTADGWAPVLPTLEKNHQVIIVEMQGHGHTADRDAALSYEQMADDAAALLKELKIDKADVFGYSLGGGAALALAIRHPESVGKLAVLGTTAGSTKETFYPDVFKQFDLMNPETFAPPELKDPYDKVAPDPKKWPVLVSKVKTFAQNFKGFSEAQVRSIKAPTLIMVGDRDAVTTEHAVHMQRLIGNSQLAVFPNADHFLLYMDTAKVLGTLTPFLDAPDKAGGNS